jgi:hypothetical protein
MDDTNGGLPPANFSEEPEELIERMIERMTAPDPARPVTKPHPDSVLAGMTHAELRELLDEMDAKTALAHPKWTYAPPFSGGMVTNTYTPTTGAYEVPNTVRDYTAPVMVPVPLSASPFAGLASKPTK